MEDRRKPPTPGGGVPQPVQPQVTAPIGAPPPHHAAPWGYPLHLPAQPHVDMKPKQSWHDVVKTALQAVAVLCTVGGILVAAGEIIGEFKSYKVSTTERLDKHEHKINEAADNASAARSSALDAATQARMINEKLERLNITGSRRSYRAVGADMRRAVPPAPPAVDLRP